ncbi:MAG: superoxide dismutase, Ni [Chloroflexi bacterium]|nr:superoxide dismutase, Ni [Chloroflexota bacterium]|tara:strand:- start:62 stop:517 length:456 start_codon:yes stop_codon:yes gene_type:complete
MNLKNLINKVTKFKTVHAHCDIPCGIYDPISAKIAAQTVLKMAIKIETLENSSDANSLNRFIAAKEKHAELVKHEIDILWHDYFKPEHLEKYPDLHTKVWNTTKLAASNKQNVDSNSANKLVDSVDEIASIFWATKGVDYTDEVAKIRFGA